MSKRWTMVATNDISFGDLETKEERLRRFQKIDKIIRNTPLIKEVKQKDSNSKQK